MSPSISPSIHPSRSIHLFSYQQTSRLSDSPSVCRPPCSLIVVHLQYILYKCPTLQDLNKYIYPAPKPTLQKSQHSACFFHYLLRTDWFQQTVVFPSTSGNIIWCLCGFVIRCLGCCIYHQRMMLHVTHWLHPVSPLIFKCRTVHWVLFIKLWTQQKSSSKLSSGTALQGNCSHTRTLTVR